MIRLYEYEPRIDAEGNTTEVYRDFQNYLFSQPYGFLWDWPADKVTINDIAYRISSLQNISSGNQNQVTCVCLCKCGGSNAGNGGGGNGGNGGDGHGGGTVDSGEIKTDHSLHGEGNDAHPLGAKLSEMQGNRLQILADGLYVGDGCDCMPGGDDNDNVKTGNMYVGGMIENRVPQNVSEITGLLVTGMNNPVKFTVGNAVTYKTPVGIMRSYVVIPAGKRVSQMYDVDNLQTLEDILVKEPNTVMIDGTGHAMYYLQYSVPAAGEKTIKITII